MVEEVKKYWGSKTLWINGLAFIAALATWVAGEVDIGAPLTIASFVNFALRFMTTKKIQI